MVKKRKIGDEGLGYAPFGWNVGWIWAREQIQKLLNAYRPEAILYGEAPHIRHGWGFLNGNRDPEVAAYNDTLGILRQAFWGEKDEGFQQADWVPPYLVIPETPNSNVNKRGIKRAEEFFIFPREVVSAVDVDWETLPSNGEVEEPPEDELDLLETMGIDEDDFDVELRAGSAWVHVSRAHRLLNMVLEGDSPYPDVAVLRRARRQLKRAIKSL